MPEAGKKGKLATIAHKFPFPPRKPQETAKAVTRNVSAVCQLPASGQAKHASYASVPEQNITQF